MIFIFNVDILDFLTFATLISIDGALRESSFRIIVGLAQASDAIECIDKIQCVSNAHESIKADDDIRRLAFV